MAWRLHRVGPAFYAPWVCSSTRVWTPLMASRRVAQTHPRRWASSLIMAATRYPRCLWPCRPASRASWVTTPTGCSFRWVQSQNIIVEPSGKSLTSLPVLLRHSSFLLRPLADLCVGDNALRTHRCDGGTVLDHSHTPDIGGDGTRSLADQGRSGSQMSHRRSKLFISGSFLHFLLLLFHI